MKPFCSSWFPLESKPYSDLSWWWGVPALLFLLCLPYFFCGFPPGSYYMWKMVTSVHCPRCSHYSVSQCWDPPTTWIPLNVLLWHRIERAASIHPAQPPHNIPEFWLLVNVELRMESRNVTSRLMFLLYFSCNFWWLFSYHLLIPLPFSIVLSSVYNIWCS